jgi:hypothetical protein
MSLPQWFAPMITCLLSLLIVAASPAAPIAERYPEAAEVFSSRFDESTDRDYDGWPDHWTRRHGPGFPHYNKMLLSSEATPAGGRTLRIEVDGGGAVASSPPMPASLLYDYIVEAYVKAERMQHDRAFLSLAMLDEDGQTLQTFYSEKIAGATGWTRLRLGPVSPDAAAAHSVVVGLHVQPAAQGEAEDLKAVALFGDVWLGRTPRMSLVADNPTRIYDDPGRIAISCKVSGLPGPAGKAVLELTDVQGATVAQIAKPLDLSPVAARTPRKKAPGEKPWTALAGTVQWKPPVLGPGFYRVRATVEGHPSEVLRRELTLVVLQARHNPEGGEFGWSLKQYDRPLRMEVLGNVLAESGIRWVKLPLWLDASVGPAHVRGLQALMDQLSLHGIEVVGVLDRPPESVLARLEATRAPSAAELFTARKDAWYPSLDWVLTNFGPQIRWWQLGRDEDTSFVGYRGLAAKIAEIKGEMAKSRPDLSLGFGWSWQHPLPESGDSGPGWRFVSLSADPPLTAGEIAQYLPALRGGPVGRWVLIQPLARGQYKLEERVNDLVERMLAAKLERAEGIFASDPFDGQQGLLNSDGTPGELFLPWRTTALLLGGAEPLQSIRLPNGSRNHVFARNGDAVMIVWNRKPVYETLYLGEQVRQVDLWGRESAPEKSEQGHRIQVGPQPAFITGVNRELAQWRRRFVLGNERIPSIFGQRQPTWVEFTNTFDQPVEGSVTLVAPEQWAVSPSRITFHLAAGESCRQDVDITLPPTVNCGSQSLRADFELTANRAYRFSAYRSVEIGIGDVRIETVTQLNRFGELEVQQWTVNEKDSPVNFRCQLFAPGRQRQATQVVGLSRGQDLKIYRFPDGKQLLGKTLWLQAQDADGPQVLNYRFVADQ